MRQNKSSSTFPLQWYISLGLHDKADNTLQRPRQPGFTQHTFTDDRNRTESNQAQPCPDPFTPVTAITVIPYKQIHSSFHKILQKNQQNETCLETPKFYCCTFTCKNRILFLPHCPTLPFNSSLLNVLCNSIIFHTVTFFPKSLGPKCVSSVRLIIFGKLQDIVPNTASWHWLTEFTVQKQKPYEPF